MKTLLYWSLLLANLGMSPAKDMSYSQQEFLAEFRNGTAWVIFAKGRKVTVDWNAGTDVLKKNWPDGMQKFDPLDVAQDLDWSNDPSFGKPDKILVVYRIIVDANNKAIARSQYKIYGDKVSVAATDQKKPVEGLYLSLSLLKKQISSGH